MPIEEKDDDDDGDHATVSASTTSVSTADIPTGTVTANPTDHPDRPVNAKPTGTNDGETAPSSTSSTVPNPSATTGSSNFLPSFFPTFGVSKRTQIWIYGSMAIIVLFCAGIGTYLYLARRKRIRNNIRDDYEFEVLDDEDEAEGNGEAGRRPARRRGGELYDAFAEESDEELFTVGKEKFRDEDVKAEAEDEVEDPGGKGDRERLLGR